MIIKERTNIKIHHNLKTMSAQINILFALLLTVIFSTSTAFGQDSLRTFPMQYEGAEVMATQDISTQLLGVYIQRKGRNKCMYKLGKNSEESYILVQSVNEDETFEWNPENKKSIEWGILTYKGKLAYMKVREFSDGKMNVYPGLVVVYKDLKTQTYKDMLLYEVKGKLTLDGIATKVSEMVSN